MRYLLAYFALATGMSGLSLLFAGSALGFPLILVAATLVYLIVRLERQRRREKKYGGFAQAIEGYERRAEGISAAKSKLEAAAEIYALTCLLEIRGFGAAAEQAVQQASSLAASQPAGDESVRLTEANESLTRAEDLVKHIEDHLASLEQAARDGRHEVERAELEVDRAWANVTAGSTSPEALQRAERIAKRGRELAADARKELEQTKPDWFRAITLARQAAEVVQELPFRDREEHGPAPDAPLGVEHARTQAEVALEQARTLVAGLDSSNVSLDSMTSLLLERGEYAYKTAVALQRQLTEAADADAVAHAAVDGFRLAEDAAAAVQEHALGLRAVDGTKRSGSVTATVVWGALGAAAAAAFRSD